jgi:hypothetical protein
MCGYSGIRTLPSTCGRCPERVGVRGGGIGDDWPAKTAGSAVAVVRSSFVPKVVRRRGCPKGAAVLPAKGNALGNRMVGCRFGPTGQRFPGRMVGPLARRTDCVVRLPRALPFAGRTDGPSAHTEENRSHLNRTSPSSMRSPQRAEPARWSWTRNPGQRPITLLKGLGSGYNSQKTALAAALSAHSAP